jgi:hypothetical protein
MAKDLKPSGNAQTEPSPLASASVPVPGQPLDLQALVEKQAKELADLRAILMATIQAQPKVSPDTIWAQHHEREMRIKEELDRLAALFQQSAKDRSQWEANRRFTEGKRLFKISVGWCPELVIRADNPIAAKAYYDEICGIRGVSTNHAKPESTTYKNEDVTSDPSAQQVVLKQWEYQAAA